MGCGQEEDDTQKDFDYADHSCRLDTVRKETEALQSKIASCQGKVSEHGDVEETSSEEALQNMKCLCPVADEFVAFSAKLSQCKPDTEVGERIESPTSTSDGIDLPRLQDRAAQMQEVKDTLCD